MLASRFPISRAETPLPKLYAPEPPRPTFPLEVDYITRSGPIQVQYEVVPCVLVCLAQRGVVGARRDSLPVMRALPFSDLASSLSQLVGFKPIPQSTQRAICESPPSCRSVVSGLASNGAWSRPPSGSASPGYWFGFTAKSKICPAPAAPAPMHHVHFRNEEAVTPDCIGPISALPCRAPVRIRSDLKGNHRFLVSYRIRT